MNPLSIFSAVPRSSRLPLGLAGLALASVYGPLFFFDPGQGRMQGVEEALYEPTGASPLIVLLGWFWMVWGRFSSILRLHHASAPSSGACVLLVAAMICLWSYFIAFPNLLLISLAITSLSAAIFLRGWFGARKLIFPSTFLMLAMPIPTPLIQQVVYPLQLANAEWAASFLSLMGFETVVSGDLVWVNSTLYQVIESCAGLRITLTVLMTAFIYGEINRYGPLRKLVLLIFAPLIGFSANFLRIISIMMNPSASLASIHTAQGVVVIIASVLALILIDWVLGRFWRGDPSVLMERPPSAWRMSSAWSWFIAFVSLATAIGAFFGPRWVPPENSQAIRLSTIRNQPAGWSAAGFKPDFDFLGSDRFEGFVARRYSNRAQPEVRLFVAADTRTDPGRAMGSEKLVVLEPGGAWNDSQTSLETPWGWVKAYIVPYPSGRQLVYSWSIGQSDWLSETMRAFFGLDRGPLRRAGSAAFVRLSTPLRGGLPSAEARLNQFMESFRPSFESLGLWPPSHQWRSSGR